MYERFTERARQVVILGQEEARKLKHDYIGTEHLLLGLLREEEGVACRVLERLDVTLDQVRAQVVRIVGKGEERAVGQVPFTPRAKKVLEFALREALSLNHNYIGTEHILLALVRVDEGVAARILLDSGADADKIHYQVLEMLRSSRRRHVPSPEDRLRRGMTELREGLKGLHGSDQVEPEALRIMLGHFERLRLKLERAGLL